MLLRPLKSIVDWSIFVLTFFDRTKRNEINHGILESHRINLHVENNLYHRGRWRLSLHWSAFPQLHFHLLFWSISAKDYHSNVPARKCSYKLFWTLAFLLTNSGALIDRRFPFLIFTITVQALSSAEIKSESFAKLSRMIWEYFVWNSKRVSTNNVGN